MDTGPQLALAHTCKKIYNYHRKQYREEIVAFLCSNRNSNCQCYKILERWLNETGWTPVKVILKEISMNFQSNNSYSIKAFHWDWLLQFPNELNYENINALIIESFFLALLPTLLNNASFMEKFSNLKMVRLPNIIIDENIVSVLSKLFFLKVISLNYCEITDDHLSKIFKVCTVLEEIELLTNGSYARPIMLPPQAKILYIEGLYSFVQIDLSRCTQFRSL
jgi:hypothetical protein